jgi:hypothetical protein
MYSTVLVIGGIRSGNARASVAAALGEASKRRWGRAHLRLRGGRAVALGEASGGAAKVGRLG